MAVLETLSTRGMAAPERLPFWNEVTARMVAPIRVEVAEPGMFQAHIRRRRCRDIELLSLTSSPAHIVSTRDLDRAGVLNLQLQLSGRSINNTGGRSCALEEGDFTLYDPTQPLSLTFSEPTEALVVRLPLASAEERLPKLRRMAGIKVRGDVGPGAAVARFLRTCWAELERDECDWAETLDDVIWPMLELAYAGERVVPCEVSRREERRRALFATIEHQLEDPDLDSATIARSSGVSARYVQMLFAEMATTPSAFIQQRRLERAARRLEGDGRAAITDVAFDVGFNDLSSFCRAFRRRFDVSPRDYRAGQRRGRAVTKQASEGAGLA